MGRGSILNLIRNSWPIILDKLCRLHSFSFIQRSSYSKNFSPIILFCLELLRREFLSFAFFINFVHFHVGDVDIHHFDCFSFFFFSRIEFVRNRVFVSGAFMTINYLANQLSIIKHREIKHNNCGNNVGVYHITRAKRDNLTA